MSELEEEEFQEISCGLFTFIIADDKQNFYIILYLYKHIKSFRTRRYMYVYV